MYLTIDLQFIVSEWSFELLSHIYLFKDQGETVDAFEVILLFSSHYYMYSKAIYYYHYS